MLSPCFFPLFFTVILSLLFIGHRFAAGAITGADPTRSEAKVFEKPSLPAQPCQPKLAMATAVQTV